MFLATTADQRFWKTEEPILFLGEWCKLYDQKHIWSKLESEVLPYHWDDREQLYQDYKYLDELNERYLKLLTKLLNELHQVDRSVRYWRILIGYWLLHSIPILYDRYLSICNASRSGRVTNTWIMPYAPGQMTPRDFSHFVNLFVSDQYNQYLYSEIIRLSKLLPFEELRTGFTPSVTVKSPRKNLLRRIARTALRAYAKDFPFRLNDIVFVASGFDVPNLTRLEIDLRQWPSLMAPNIETPQTEINQTMRQRLVLDEGRNEFEMLLDKFLPEQLPSAYAESYQEMHNRSLDAFPRKPKLIVTGTGYAQNEGFKFWSAHQVENGAKLAVLQHGGHYGSGLWSATEDFEIKISDRFYTWGWQDDRSEKTVPAPAPNLIKFARAPKPDPQGRLLWVQNSMPRYSYFMYSIPAGPQMLEYLSDQHRFLEMLEPRVRDLLLLRLYPSDYGWSEANRWQDIDPALCQDRGREALRSQMRRSRLLISTNNSTTFLETLAANFPTVIFWNPRHWELRPSAQDHFDELRRVGILHDTPEAAAAQVNAIYEDVVSWWQGPEIQRVRDRFCRQFARTGQNWLNEWRKELVAQVR
ncbi:MAG TPA: LIC12162 family protein [Pyrinomonadaceae bacterium]|nr:LIC12162 family protein [Pyrinomonadaceae bacterium]